MSTIQIDRLLDTVVRTGASDLHCTVGRKPTLRLHGGLKNLDTKVLDGDDCVALMKQITPEKAQQELQETRRVPGPRCPKTKRCLWVWLY